MSEIEKIKALGMALGSNASEKWGGSPPVATCPHCSEPLIGTLRFRGYEFVCVCCERKWGFVEPVPKESTPELMARYAELKAKWDNSHDDEG